jgi:anti-sigma B factor antagonist
MSADTPNAEAAPLRALDGELTIRQAAELQVVIAQWLATGMTELDLSGVHECDSAGLQLLIAAGRSARQQGRALALVEPSAAVRELFDRYALTGLLSAEASGPAAHTAGRGAHG